MKLLKIFILAICVSFILCSKEDPKNSTDANSSLNSSNNTISNDNETHFYANTCYNCSIGLEKNVNDHYNFSGDKNETQFYQSGCYNSSDNFTYNHYYAPYVVSEENSTNSTNATNATNSTNSTNTTDKEAAKSFRFQSVEKMRKKPIMKY